MARTRALGTSPESYASSGDVDIGCARASVGSSIAVTKPAMATTLPDLRTGATLTACIEVDEFSAPAPSELGNRKREAPFT
jgi:hypothetical protein